MYKKWEQLHITVEQEYNQAGEYLNKDLAAIKFFTEECLKNNICPTYPIIEKFVELRNLK